MWALAVANVSGVNILTMLILDITALIALLSPSLNPTSVLLEEFEISNWRLYALSGSFYLVAQ